MRLTSKTTPKKLTLGQAWELFRMDTGVESSGFIIKMLDFSYPNKNRDGMDVFGKMKKYEEAKKGYTEFCNAVKGMVGNG